MTHDKKTQALLACAEVTPAQIASLSPAQIASLSRAQIASLSVDLNLDVPKVEHLYSRIAADIDSQKRKLDQATFGPENGVAEDAVCQTPMCIAGHTVNLAGEAGYALKDKFGWLTAAELIHRKSRPDAPLPRYDSYPSEWALAYIQERAAEEQEDRTA